MPILTKEVKIRVNGKHINYYKSLGYEIPIKKASKRTFEKHGNEYVYDYSKEITVKIKDLPKNSHVEVEVLCDMCKINITKTTYQAYNRSIEKYGNYSCRDCSYKKSQKTNLERYGVEYPFQSEAIQEKVKITCMEKYGVENILLAPEIQEKIKQTNIEKYGVENVFCKGEIRDRRDTTLIEKYGTVHPLQNKECFEKLKQTNLYKYGMEYASQVTEFKEKAKQTSLKKYGTENPLFNLEIKEKVKQTNLKRYGVECILSLPEFHEHSREVDMERYGVYHHLQNPEILAKQKKTFYKNGTCPTSKQQEHLFNLYRLKNKDVYINFSISYYNADICFANEKLIVEYDGSGHDLRVALGHLTQEEFDQKEIIRFNIIKSEGYKQMRIISTKDLLPSDDVLLQMLDMAREYFSTTFHTWIKFDIDNSRMINAENKNTDGVFFNYKELRKIK